MKHVKTFEGFLNEAKVNEMYSPKDNESIFYGVIRGIADGILKANGSNLSDWLENSDIAGTLDDESPEAVEKTVKSLFGGWSGTKNFTLGPNPEDVPDADEAQKEVQDLIKSGFKFVGSVNMDGYEAIVLGTRKGGAGDLQVATPLMNASDYIDNYYNM
jgi:hypothetical protein